MATAKKKKTKSIGQVAYLTKQVASLEKDLIRKDIKQLNTDLTAKIDKVDTKVDNLETNLNTKIDSLKNNNKITLDILAVLVTAIFYLHNDTKQDMNSRFDKIERAIENINQKLK